jgi:hypothetical protein
VINGNNSPKTKALTLKDVCVVEGFYINITPKIKLRKARI